METRTARINTADIANLLREVDEYVRESFGAVAESSSSFERTFPGHGNGRYNARLVINLKLNGESSE